jgi:thiol-disulfide isomerase/thioredoxin
MRNVFRAASFALLALCGAPAFAAEDLPGKFTKLAAPAPAPEVSFTDGEGRELGLDAFRGKWTLVNFWATWCAPCRAEMKDLDELEAKLGGDRFVVVALSADRQGRPVVEAFYTEIGIERLAIYLDPAMKAARAFRAIGLPTTVLLDPAGREVGRALGPVAWASEASVQHLRRLMGD